jgi:hypothetical protein
MEELFVKVINKNGKEIKIVRNNGIEELTQRWSNAYPKMDRKKKSNN